MVKLHQTFIFKIKLAEFWCFRYKTWPLERRFVKYFDILVYTFFVEIMLIQNFATIVRNAQRRLILLKVCVCKNNRWEEEPLTDQDYSVYLTDHICQAPQLYGDATRSMLEAH